jgi:hypothetical protein
MRAAASGIVVGFVRKFLLILSLAALAVLAFAVRCHRLREVFVEGRIYFADPDCYSRMTRARTVDEGAAWSIRHHDFENWPAGITPHTTAPLDWAIVALKRILDLGFALWDSPNGSVLRGQTLDLAGALIGPLLAVIACGCIGWLWPREMAGGKWPALASVFLFAVSPVLVHGTALGRPDHQAPLIALLVIVFVLELRFLSGFATRGGHIAAGILWGCAWWLSLYEPLLLFVASTIGLALARPAAFRERARWWQWGTMLVVFGAAILVDGWRLQMPSPELRGAFERWKGSIGEMRGLDLRSVFLFQWLGAACWLAPVALLFQWRSRVEARWLMVLLAAVFALAIWQIRWGYFLALVYALSLPVQFAVLRRRWIAVVVWIVGLWPVAADWDRQLFPDEAVASRKRIQGLEMKTLRAIAESQAEQGAGPFLAPWWLSPAIAYWSRQPGVAGSSHQSLPGTIDAARIFLAPDADAALPILQERGVAWIVAEIPERVVPTSAALLAEPEPPHAFVHDLMGKALPEPWTNRIVLDRGIARPAGYDLFPIWRVRSAAKPATILAR